MRLHSALLGHQSGLYLVNRLGVHTKRTANVGMSTLDYLATNPVLEKGMHLVHVIVSRVKEAVEGRQHILNQSADDITCTYLSCSV